jgi:hypothetical protein
VDPGEGSRLSGEIDRAPGGASRQAAQPRCPAPPRQAGLLRFQVELREGDRTIGTGAHERRVIDTAAFDGGGGS